MLEVCVIVSIVVCVTVVGNTAVINCSVVCMIVEGTVVMLFGTSKKYVLAADPTIEMRTMTATIAIVSLRENFAKLLRLIC